MNPSFLPRFLSRRGIFAGLWTFLLLSLFPVLARASFITTVSNGQVTITGYNGTSTALVIPSQIGGMPVIAIGVNAFYSHKGLISVTIPNGVTTIGDHAFDTCTGLTNVTIPNSVTTIGSYAFATCTSLTNVTVPNSVTSIGDHAFYSCTSLLSATIPTGVTSIGDNVFGSCTSLTSVTIPDSITSIGNGTFAGCYSLTSLTIPNSVTSIGRFAFAVSGLKSVTIPNSVTYIGDEAFGYSALTGITVPSSVNYMDGDPFSGGYFTAINVDPQNPAYCSVDGVLFNKSQTTLIGYPAGRVGSYDIPSGVTAIGDAAFEDSFYNLSSVTIPNSVTSIGDYAFEDCYGPTSVTIPASVTSIGDFAFADCARLASTIFEGDVPQTMGANVFSVADIPFAGGCRIYYYQGAAGFTSPTWTDSAGDSYSSVSLIRNAAPQIFGLNGTGSSGLSDHYKVPLVFTIVASSFPTSFQATGLPPGLSLDSATGIISGAPTDIGTFNVTLGATNAYGTGSLAFTFTVYKAAQTITFPAIAAQIYLGPSLALSAAASSGLAITYTVVSGPATLSGNTLAFSGAGTVTVTASQAGDGYYYYAATDVTESFTVNPAAQTITFPSIAAQTYLGPPLALGATASSGLAVTYTVTSGPATLSGNTLTFTGGGAVTVKASQAGNGNYLAAADVSESFPVKAAAQKITFPVVASGTVGKTIALVAASSSGLPIGYSIVPTAGYTGTATISGSKIKFTGAGKIKLAADQAGNANFLPAVEVRQIVQVVGTQSISFPAVVSGMVGKTVTLAGTSSSGLKVSYSIVPTAGFTGTATISGAKIKFTGAGRIKLAADQAGNASYLPAVEVRQVVEVAAP